MVDSQFVEFSFQFSKETLLVRAIFCILLEIEVELLQESIERVEVIYLLVQKSLLYLVEPMSSELVVVLFQSESYSLLQLSKVLVQFLVQLQLVLFMFLLVHHP